MNDETTSTASSTQNENAARIARERRERWVSGRAARMLLCLSGVSFMIMLDSNIVAVSLPAIARNLNAAFSDIEWVISAYVLTFAALLMPAGALADRFGRRRMLILGLVTFTVASFLCGLAPSSLILNASRALQGVGAAVQLSAALAALGHAFRGASRAKAFAFWGTVIGVAVAVGPLVGGVITTALGWRWAFLVNVPVGQTHAEMLVVRSSKWRAFMQVGHLQRRSSWSHRPRCLACQRGTIYNALKHHS